MYVCVYVYVCMRTRMRMCVQCAPITRPSTAQLCPGTPHLKNASGLGSWNTGPGTSTLLPVKSATSFFLHRVPSVSKKPANNVIPVRMCGVCACERTCRRKQASSPHERCIKEPRPAMASSSSRQSFALQRGGAFGALLRCWPQQHPHHRRCPHDNQRCQVAWGIWSCGCVPPYQANHQTIEPLTLCALSWGGWSGVGSRRR